MSICKLEKYPELYRLYTYSLSDVNITWCYWIFSQPVKTGLHRKLHLRSFTLLFIDMCRVFVFFFQLECTAINYLCDPMYVTLNCSAICILRGNKHMCYPGRLIYHWISPEGSGYTHQIIIHIVFLFEVLMGRNVYCFVTKISSVNLSWTSHYVKSTVE